MVQRKLNRINIDYQRRDELMKKITKLKKDGKKVNLTIILEALLNQYLDEKHDLAAKGKDTHEYMKILLGENDS